MSNGRRCLTALVEDEFLTNVIIKNLQEIVRGLCVCSAGLPLRLGIACRHILARRLPPKISGSRTSTVVLQIPIFKSARNTYGGD